MKNTVQHTFYGHSRWKRKTMLDLLLSKSKRQRLKLREFYFSEVMRSSPLPKQPLETLLTSPPTLMLENFLSRNGNISPLELMAIVSICKEREAKRILEIGTFDGNTTLQLALNSPCNAQIQTLDLPENATSTAAPVLQSDVQFIHDEQKWKKRKYEGARVEHKIVQLYGDSTVMDFSLFAKDGPIDFLFIDGGHSYDCVKNDTEKGLQILSEKGCIFWHDYTPLFGGVYQFLCELSKSLPLTHIEGTNLVFYSGAE